MLYADYKFFTDLYGFSITEQTFNRLIWVASKLLDHATAGAGGYNKLQNAYPANPSDDEAVKRCACALVDFAYSVEQASNAFGYVTNADGNITSRMIASKSSGSESISYVTGNSVKTAAVVAASDNEVRQQMQYDIIRQYLSGVRDANGVNLLYLGRYPRVHRHDNLV